MVALYLDNSQQLLADIESAVASRDDQKVVRAAHTLRGVLMNMCAEKCARAASQSEAIAATGDLAQADQSLSELKDEFGQLQSVLIEHAEVQV